MRTFELALLSLLLLLALGCRTDPNQVLMEQESRRQEDQIWHLKALLDDCHAAREATIRENESLKKELAGGDRGAGSDYSSPSTEPPSTGTPPRRSRGKGSAPPLEAPVIELPEPSDTPPPAQLKPGEGSGAAVEGRPTQLVINKRLTGGLDRDGRGGDEGILVVVEPRDAAGQLVMAPGTVSVVLMDPAQPGGDSRVARWDFTSDEVPSHFQNTAFGSGLRFELPWPAEPPKNRDLRLFVRFTTAEGEKLNTDATIEVKTPGEHETKSWSATQSASRPSRSTPKAPASRVKSSGSRSRSPRDTDNGEPPRWDSRQGTHNREENEPVRQAMQSDRPEWKPYR